MNFKKYTGGRSSTLLTLAGASGVIITAMFTGLETPKALQNIDALGTEASIPEKIKTLVKCYPKTLVSGALTITAILGSNRISKKQQAALVGSYVALAKKYHDYRSRIDPEKDVSARASSIREDYERQEHYDVNEGQETLLFYDEYSDRYFERTMAEVIDAEYHLNRNFILKGAVDLNEFYLFLGLEPTPLGRCIGWSFYLGVESGYQWVDFYNKKITIDDGSKNQLECFEICMPFAPLENYDPW